MYTLYTKCTAVTVVCTCAERPLLYKQSRLHQSSRAEGRAQTCLTLVYVQGSLPPDRPLQHPTRPLARARTLRSAYSIHHRERSPRGTGRPERVPGLGAGMTYVYIQYSTYSTYTSAFKGSCLIVSGSLPTRHQSLAASLLGSAATTRSQQATGLADG